MNIGKLKGPEKLLQVTGKHKSRERKSGYPFRVWITCFPFMEFSSAVIYYVIDDQS
jgi:hypothetical protein